jgi:hypothetical protein
LEDKMTGSNHVSAGDISSKWSKVTQAEAAAIRNTDSLSAQVQKSYGLDKAKADAEVKAFMSTRTFYVPQFASSPATAGEEARAHGPDCPWP